MDPKTKKKLIIGLSLTTILGVGGYFAYKWWKDNRPAGEGNDDDNNDTNVSNTNQQVISPPSSPSSSSGSAGSRPGDVLAFQKWANNDGYKPALEEDGLWGPKTKAAWNSKKAGYTASADVQANVGQLSGQLKVIYDKFMASSELKANTKAYKNSSTGVMNVSTVGNKSGKKYVYVAGGSLYIYNSAGTQIAAGNYTDNGLKIVVTLGPAKGKTFTGTSILKVANLASSNPNMQQTLSNNDVTDIVVKMYDAMDGAGTKLPQFMSQWARMKTYADWSAVYNAFDKKEGDNLWTWMKEESALQTPQKRAYFNKWFKDKGSSNRF